MPSNSYLLNLLSTRSYDWRPSRDRGLLTDLSIANSGQTRIKNQHATLSLMLRLCRFRDQRIVSELLFSVFRCRIFCSTRA